MNATQTTATMPIGRLQAPRCHGPRTNRSPASSRRKIGIAYAMYRPMTEIEVTAKYAAVFQIAGSVKIAAPATASQMELVGVRVRLLIRCQKFDPGSAPSREKA